MSFLPISEIGNLPRGDAHGMVLYRLYDDMKSLLYVGITSNIVTRVNTHSRTKIWFQKAKSINIEKCKNRTQAESLEKIAILNEKPRYNKTYNPLVLNYNKLFLLKDLTSNQRNILDCVFMIMSRDYRDNQIQLTPKVKESIAKYAQCKVSSVNMAFTVFCKKDIVQKEANTIYMVNPDLVFKGKQDKRARLIITYFENGKRTMKIEEV